MCVQVRSREGIKGNAHPIMYLAVDVYAKLRGVLILQEVGAVAPSNPDRLQDVANGGAGLHQELEEAQALLGVEQRRRLGGHKAVPVEVVLHELEQVLSSTRVALQLRPLAHDAHELGLDAGGRETADRSKWPVKADVGDEVGRPGDLADGQRGDARHEEPALAAVVLDDGQDAPQDLTGERCFVVVAQGNAPSNAVVLVNRDEDR